jgi:hypothetical protein
MLINLSADEEVLANLAEDDAFVETLLIKLTVRVRGASVISVRRLTDVSP